MSGPRRRWIWKNDKPSLKHTALLVGCPDQIVQQAVGPHTSHLQLSVADGGNLRDVMTRTMLLVRQEAGCEHRGQEGQAACRCRRIPYGKPTGIWVGSELAVYKGLPGRRWGFPVVILRSLGPEWGNLTEDVGWPARPAV